MNTRRKSFVSRTNSRRKPSGLQRGKVGEVAGQAVPRPRYGTHIVAVCQAAFKGSYR